MTDDDIRVVVGVDFGTTFSGFAYGHVVTPNDVSSQRKWPTGKGRPQRVQDKANTILHYDLECKEVLRWGCATVEKLAKKPNAPEFHIAELFKLHFTECDEKPALPGNVSYEQATRDYLKQMNELISGVVQRTWPQLSYPQHIRFVFSVPAEYGDKQKARMRHLIHEAGFMDTVHSRNLQFTTEPEAAAIYCLKRGQEYNLAVNEKYLIVDLGGGTCDLTMCKLLDDEKISEITERTGDTCGGCFVDREFINFLDDGLGGGIMEKIRSQHYHQYQCLVNVWCRDIKHSFTGEDFGETFRLELDRECPAIKKLVTGSFRDELEGNDWMYEFDFDTIKRSFDPPLERILELIQGQLACVEGAVAVMFLVGGLSESLYVQSRIRDAFQSQVQQIVVPQQPVTAIVRGATFYGLKMNVVESRQLKWTYGLETNRQWKPTDPSERCKDNNKIEYFHILAQRGQNIRVDETVSIIRYPLQPESENISFPIYVTKAYNARFTDENGMILLGKLEADLPDNHLGKDRPVEFSLTFGTSEITVTAINKRTNQKYNQTLKYSP